MFFVEYTAKNGQKKAVNLKDCHTIEISKKTDGTYTLKLYHEFKTEAIGFESEEDANRAFETLMIAIKNQKSYWSGISHNCSVHVKNKCKLNFLPLLPLIS